MIHNLLADRQTGRQADRQTGRQEWIDCLKGLAILLVIWGHTQNESPLNTWIQSFHVSIFLVISGYLYAEQNKRISSFDRTVYKLIKPYFIFSAFAMMMNVLMGYLSNAAVGKGLLIDAYKTVSLYGIHAIWYLPSYVIATFVVLKADSWAKRGATFFGGISISILGNYFFAWTESQMPGIVNGLIYYPSASIIRGVACAAIMVVGFGMSVLLKESKKKGTVFAISLICLALSLLISRFTVGSNFSTVHYGRHPMALYFCAITGSVGCFLLFHSWQDNLNHFRFLRYCGNNSLILLVTHSTFKLHQISRWLVGRFFDINATAIIQNVAGIVCLILIMIVEVPIIYALTKTPIKKIIN